MINFYFVRHAESEANIDTRNIIGGHNLSCKLTPTGIEQAVALGTRFKTESKNFDIAYSSTATRTRETARIVLETAGYNFDLNLTPDLLELGSGDWEGKSRNIYQRPDVRSALDTNNWKFVPGDLIKGESQSDVAKRMIRWTQAKISQYKQMPNEFNILVFSHGLAIGMMLTELMGWDRRTAYKIRIDNTSITHLSYDTNELLLSMLYFGDTSHYSLM